MRKFVIGVLFLILAVFFVYEYGVYRTREIENYAKEVYLGKTIIPYCQAYLINKDLYGPCDPSVNDIFNITLKIKDVRSVKAFGFLPVGVELIAKVVVSTNTKMYSSMKPWVGTFDLITDEEDPQTYEITVGLPYDTSSNRHNLGLAITEIEIIKVP